MVGETLDWKEELGRFSQAVSGSVGSQGAAANVSALRVGTDRLPLHSTAKLCDKCHIQADARARTGRRRRTEIGAGGAGPSASPVRTCLRQA